MGTVYVGLSGPDGSRAERLGLAGDRQAIRERTCGAALDRLAAALTSS